MIKYLNGIQEIVDYEELSTIRIYANVEYEEYPVHWHPAIEIIVPISGPYEVKCSNQMFHLKEGDILFIVPGTLHHLFPAHGKRLIFLLDSTTLQSIHGFNHILSFIDQQLLITKAKNPDIHKLCHALLMHSMETYFSAEPFKQLIIFSDLLKFLSLLGHLYTAPNVDFSTTVSNKRQEYIYKFMNLCEYIDAHCSENLSLEQVAEMSGYSQYHFSRLFKNFTGNSFYKHLNLCRISHAEQLLLDPDTKITEVALRSGFNSISSFIRMFKIVKECTPTDFRNMLQREKNVNDISKSEG